jgi:hypothetical protein
MPRRGEKGRLVAEPGSVTFMYHSCSLSNKSLLTAEDERLGWARDQGLNARDAERMCKDLAEAASQLASARKQEDRKAAMLAVLKGTANSPRESEADEYSVQLVNRVYDRPDLSPNKLAAAEYMRCMMLQ